MVDMIKLGANDDPESDLALVEQDQLVSELMRRNVSSLIMLQRDPGNGRGPDQHMMFWSGNTYAAIGLAHQAVSDLSKLKSLVK